MITCPHCGFESPPEFNYCGRCGARLAPPSPLPVPTQGEPLPLEGGERRLVTVLMADVSGSTTLLEAHGSEEWVALMNDLLQTLSLEVYRFGGRVDQFRGDGLVAFFGTRGASEDDAERAILAALAMQDVMEAARSRQAHRLPPVREDRELLRLRIGIHTGEVILAQIGDNRLHQEDTAMGRALALAARLEMQAEPGAIWVSGTTYEPLAGRFEWIRIGPVHFKGFSWPIEIYRPLAKRPDEYGFTSPPGTILRGRKRELHRLLRLVADLQQNGCGGVVLLTAERGMGKSRLLQQARTESGTVWLSGRSRSYEQAVPYSLWLSLLRRQFGIREGDSPQETRTRILRQMEAVDSRLAAEFADWLGDFLYGSGRPAEERPADPRFKFDLYLRESSLARSTLEQPQGEIERQSLFWQTRRYLRAFARQNPLVIEFDDLHWADETSLELLKFCLPLGQEYPLLFILSTRPLTGGPTGRFLTWLAAEFPSGVQHLFLRPLKSTESHALLDEMLGPQTLPDPVQALLVQRAEGNPYFLEQLVHMLIEKRSLVQDPLSGRWELVGDVSLTDLPGSLQGLLQAQIDDLPPSTRRLLQTAAVIGSPFWEAVVRPVMGERPLEAELNTLLQAGIVERRQSHPKLGWAFHFVSNLLRDVVYQSLLTRKRQAIHRRVGGVLENLLGEPDYQSAGLLAYHFERAGEVEQAIRYIFLAAERAEQAAAVFESIALYGQAVDLLRAAAAGRGGEKEKEEGEEREEEPAALKRLFEALSRRRALFERVGQQEEMRADAQALLDLAQALADEKRLVDALLQQPGVATWRSNDELAQGQRLAQQAFDLAVKIGDRPRQLHGLMAMANHMRFRGDSLAVVYAEKALRMARELGDQTAELYILIWLGITYEWSDQTDRANSYFELAHPLSKRLKDKQAEIELLKQVGLRAEREGDYYRSLMVYLQRRRQLARLTGNRLAEAQAAMLQGMVRGIYLGDLRAGLQELVNGRRLWQGTRVEAIALVYIAHILILQGDLAAASQALDHSTRHHASVENDTLQVARALVQAMWHNEQGEITGWHNALGLSAHVQNLSREKPLLSRQFGMAAGIQAAVAHLGLAEALPEERAYHVQRALSQTTAALAIYDGLGYTQITECVGETVSYWHGRALAAAGNLSAAEQFYERAYREMMRKADLIPADSHFRQTFLEELPIHRLIQAARPAGRP